MDAPNVETMREMGDYLKAKLGSVFVVLASVINDRPMFVAMATPDLTAKGDARRKYREAGWRKWPEGVGVGARRWRRREERTRARCRRRWRKWPGWLERVGARGGEYEI